MPTDLIIALWGVLATTWAAITNHRVGVIDDRLRRLEADGSAPDPDVWRGEAS